MATKRPQSLLRSLRFLAFIAAILGSAKLVSTAVFYVSAIPAQGIILDFATNEAAFGPGRTPLIAFIDYRNQKQLAAPESALGTEALFLGQKVPIRYSPDNPQFFHIYTPLGMWGSGVLRLLAGLIPFIFLSFLIGAGKKRGPVRAGSRQKKPRLKALHLTDHSKSVANTDKPVVRRMR